MKPAFHPWLEAAPAAGNPAGACICCRTHHCSQQAAETKSCAPPAPAAPARGAGAGALAPRVQVASGMTGFRPERNLVIESTALWRDFLPVSQGPGAAGRGRQGPAAGGCADLTSSLGRFLGGCPFHTLHLGCVRVDKKIRIHHGKTKTAVTGSKVISWKRWRGAGQPLPPPQHSPAEGLH